MVAGLGEKLAELREVRDLSQQKVADALGLSKTAIGEYENSTKTPSAEVMLRLASFYGVTTDYLYGFDKSVKIDLRDMHPKLQKMFLKLVADFQDLKIEE